MRPVTDGRGDGWDLWEGICDLIDWNAEGCRLAQTFILDQEDVLTIDLIWGPEKNQDSVSTTTAPVWANLRKMWEESKGIPEGRIPGLLCVRFVDRQGDWCQCPA